MCINEELNDGERMSKMMGGKKHKKKRSGGSGEAEQRTGTHLERGEVIELRAEERELLLEARVLVALRVGVELAAAQLHDLRLELHVVALELGHLARERRLAPLVLLELHEYESRVLHEQSNARGPLSSEHWSALSFPSPSPSTSIESTG